MGHHVWGLPAAGGFAGHRHGVGLPTFLTAIARYTQPGQWADSLGIFRLWRDLGYVIGALMKGFIADWLGLGASVAAIGLLTFCSALVVYYRMNCPKEATELNYGVRVAATPTGA